MGKKGGGAGDYSGKKNPELAAISDQEKASEKLFYEKVQKLNESSGFSLVFNFRDAMLDLHHFYKEVMKRGGFYQVTKMGKWDDIASASNLKSPVFMSAAQLQNVYEMLILQYELMYSRKIPDQANKWPDKSSLGMGVSPGCSTGKRKHCDRSSPFLAVDRGNRDGPTDKLQLRDDTCQVATVPQEVHRDTNMITLSNTNIKESAVDPYAPTKPRTGYQIFLRLETHKLKMIHGENSNSQNLRAMATKAWRSLPEKDKLPYIEASKMDRDRFAEEMAAYKQQQDNQNTKSEKLLSNTTPRMLNFSTSSEKDDVYHVTLENDSENSHLPDESMVKRAIEVMKNAKSNDTIFTVDLDNSSLDTPS